MAKKKKHKKKQNNHKNKVVQSTTIVKKPTKDIEKSVGRELDRKENKDTQAKENTILSDVRYSLMLVSIIVLVFIGIFVALQNSSVANSVYGIVKLNNLNF